MADSTRQRKVADRIQTTVARTLERRIKDPRLGFITITDCRVTGDLQNATVYYTVLGDEKQRKLTAQALRSAKGILRSEVGKALGIRLTPELVFEHDTLQESAAEFDDALARALERDKEIAQQAAQAKYAGEADPYRQEGEGSELGEEEQDD
ncbi:MAG: 30S ribosome-binding factor RbfA [Actinomycetaceae bacterium]|nr:30S ribosome-binding factor RbfA [Actinomycetaceae bacterium]